MLPAPNVTNPQTRPVLLSCVVFFISLFLCFWWDWACSLFLKKKWFFLFKIALWGGSLGHFQVHMYYNPTCFIPSFCPLYFVPLPFLMCRKYIHRIHILKFILLNVLPPIRDFPSDWVVLHHILFIFTGPIFYIWEAIRSVWFSEPG
jgi:hypothetical protein